MLTFTIYYYIAYIKGIINKKLNKIYKKVRCIMLNYIWAFMILVGIITAAFSGKMDEVTNAFLNSSKDGISLCIVMLGVVGMWTGIMKIAEKAGIVDALTRKMRPINRFLFPRIPENDVANSYIATNMIANFLGLGWAATPSGLKAMEELKRLNNNSEIASNEMCMFLIINISSIQLIPINIIAYRSQYGSVSPARILMPAIIATFTSTIVGVIYAVIKDRQKTNK